MEPSLSVIRMLALPNTINLLSYRTTLLAKSQEQRSQKFHSMSFVSNCKLQPIRNRIICRHSAFGIKYIRYDHIFRLDIAMSYSQVMKVIDGSSDLSNNDGGLFLIDFLFFDSLVKRATVHVLQNNIEMSFIIKTSIHFQNVGML